MTFRGRRPRECYRETNTEDLSWIEKDGSERSECHLELYRGKMECTGSYHDMGLSQVLGDKRCE